MAGGSETRVQGAHPRAVFPPVASLVPHAGRAVLIDAIVEDSENHVAAMARITAAHPYHVAGHGVPAWVGVEMMAQTIAAHGALGASRDGTRTPRSGMLLGTRHYDARVAWFAEGSELRIQATQTFGHNGGMAACDCSIERAGRLLAVATIIILEEPDP